MNPLISTGDDLLDVPSGDPAKFCRLCFSELDVEELFPDGQGIRQDVIERIHKCTGIQITLEDDYPSAVCWMCLMFPLLLNKSIILALFFIESSTQRVVSCNSS